MTTPSFDPPSLPPSLEREALAALDAAPVRREERMAELLAENPGHAKALLSIFAAAVSKAPATTTPPSTATADDSIPSHIGAYRIESRLGAGGMGEVFLATQTNPIHRRVAVKVMKHWTSEFRRRFEFERQALERTDHPFVARVLDAGVLPAGAPYLVMEYVDGQPVTSFCDEQRLGLNDRLRLFVKICHGVQHAHHKGVIHRDLKPSNILVTTDGQNPVPKIIDFGLARAVDRGIDGVAAMTATGLLLGTPAYMSPEQAGLGNVDIDARTDVFSLGVVLFELLVGRLPFVDDAEVDWRQLLSRLCSDDAPRPSTRTRGRREQDVALSRRSTPGGLARQVRGDLDRITLQAMRRDRQSRYQTPGDLAADIERYLARLPIEAGDQSNWYRLARFVQRNRVGVIGALLVVVMVLLSLASAALWVVRAADADAREVNVFWSELVVITDPRLKGGMTRLTEILEEAARRLDAGRLTKPTLEAQVRAVVGESFASLGLPRKAARELDRALDLWRDDPPPPLSLAAILSTAGTAHYDLNNLPQAETRWREALDLLRAHAGESAPRTLLTRGDLGLLLERRGDLDGAEQVWHAALAPVLSDPSMVHVALTIRENLANLLTQRGKPAEAEPVLQDILRLRRISLGPLHVETLTTLNILGAALYGVGRFDEAAAAFQECWEGRRAVLDPRADVIFNVGSNLGAALARSGRAAEAAERLTTMVDDATRALGAKDPTTLLLRNSLGNVLGTLGRTDEAVAVLAPAFEDAESALRNDPTLLAALAHNLGQSETALKHFDAAERHLKQALDVRAKLPDPIQRAQTRAALVRLYEAWSKPDEAAKWR